MGDGSATTEVVPVDKDWQEIVRKDVPTNPMVHFDIENLEPNSHYQLKIRSRNDVDWSEYSEHLFRTAPGKNATVIPQRRQGVCFSSSEYIGSITDSTDRVRHEMASQVFANG